MAQTLNYWKTSHPDVPVLGIHETEEDANSVKVLEVNGIKILSLIIHMVPTIPVPAKAKNT